MVIISILIGFLIALAEIITFYPRKRIRDFLCFGFVAFIALNGLFAAITYYLLPIILQNARHSLDPITRAILSGFGYAVFLKSKLLTIRLEDRNFSIGPAFIYDSFYNYFMRNINRSISKKEWCQAALIAERFPQLQTYVLAVNTVWMSKRGNIQNELEKQDIIRLKSLRNQILTLYNQNNNTIETNDKVKHAALLMLYHFGDRLQVNSLLNVFASS